MNLSLRLVSSLALARQVSGFLRPCVLLPRAKIIAAARRSFSKVATTATHIKPNPLAIREIHSRTRSHLTSSRKTFTEFHALSNNTKTNVLFDASLKRVIAQYGIKPQDSVEKNWDLLTKFLSTNNICPLRKLDPSNSFFNLSSLLHISLVPLIRGTHFNANPEESDYITTPTEFYWANQDIGVPFTRHDEDDPLDDLEALDHIISQSPYSISDIRERGGASELDKRVLELGLLGVEKDAAAAILLCSPLIDKNTLLYEMGCWNGQNLMSLLLFAGLFGKSPKVSIGTDINIRALNMARFALDMIGADQKSVQLYLSNAKFPLEPECLELQGIHREIRIALRLIPVLEPTHAKIFLNTAREQMQKNSDSSIILSYALPEGASYFRLLETCERSNPTRFSKQEFDEGVSIFQEFPKDVGFPTYLGGHEPVRVVINTYYTPDEFSSLAKSCGFTVGEEITVHGDSATRNVVRLTPV